MCVSPLAGFLLCPSVALVLSFVVCSSSLLFPLQTHIKEHHFLNSEQKTNTISRTDRVPVSNLGEVHPVVKTIMNGTGVASGGPHPPHRRFFFNVHFSIVRVSFMYVAQFGSTPDWHTRAWLQHVFMTLLQMEADDYRGTCLYFPVAAPLL